VMRSRVIEVPHATIPSPLEASLLTRDESLVTRLTRKPLDCVLDDFCAFWYSFVHSDAPLYSSGSLHRCCMHCICSLMDIL